MSQMRESAVTGSLLIAESLNLQACTGSQPVETKTYRNRGGQRKIANHLFDTFNVVCGCERLFLALSAERRFPAAPLTASDIFIAAND